jgi:hypothetical protein
VALTGEKARPAAADRLPPSIGFDAATGRVAPAGLPPTRNRASRR